MGKIQSNFNLFHGNRMEGQLDSGVECTIDSKTIKATEEVAFGKATLLEDGYVASSKIKAGVFAGIAVRKFKTMGMTLTGTQSLTYKAGETADLLTQGYMIMKCKGAITAGPLAVDATGNLVPAVAGAFAIEGGSVLEAGANDELVLVSLNGGRAITVIS